MYDPETRTLYLRWSRAFGHWVVCEETDKGAVTFRRAISVQPVASDASHRS